MKIHLANLQDRIGGGWTFSNRFAEGLGGNCQYEEAEVYFISGPTLASHSEVAQAKQDGKKVVLRVDNAVRDSRNRGTGMSRLKAFCDVADLVIYQSKWAREFLYPFTEKDGPVILNGVDTKKFNKEGHATDESYLYARSSRDEGKGWINAWYWYASHFPKQRDSRLDIVGKFSGENLEWGFDFFNGEKFRFLGEQKDMAPIYRDCKYFLYSFWFDACSNTLLEAIASGCEIVDVHGALQTGGAPEIMECKDISLERMLKEYEEEIGKLL